MPPDGLWTCRRTTLRMRIKEIRPSQRVKGRFLVCLDNEDIIRVGEGEMISFALHAGLELGPEELEALKQAAAVGKLKERAFAMVARKPMSRRALGEKLLELEPEDEAAVCAVLDRLEELGLLDDAAYAKTVVRYYSRKVYGEAKLRDELYRRKVPRELWEEALAEAEPSEEGVDVLIAKKLDGIEAPERKDFQRVSNALARRGFGWEEIRDGMERYRNRRE